MRRKRPPQLTLPGMPASTPAEGERWRTKDLFTEPFLESTPLVPEEAERAQAAMAAAVEEIRSLLERHKSGAPGWNERALCKRLIEPVLDALGWQDCDSPAPTVEIKPNPQRPDYALFGSPESCKDGVREKKVVPGAKVLAWVEAEPWKQDLAASRTEKKPKKVIHPEAQIRNYILLPQSQWPVRWGILTNGRLWRLYHRDSVAAGALYEVNLEQAVAEDELWRRFFLFFRREAFSEGGFLDRLREENERARQELAKHLRDAVYNALREVAQGFLDHPDNGLSPDEATLKEIRWASFILLFRLLFVLFAEHYDLLPWRTNEEYRRHSLETVIGEIGDREPEAPPVRSQRVTARGDALRGLFDIINRGDPTLGVSEYNGTLFEKEALAPKLLDDPGVRIADGWLARALYFLTHDKEGNRLNYGGLGSRDIALRELGSVYEGLLEQQVKCARENMVWVRLEKGKRGEKALTESEAQKHERSRWGDPIPAGTVYLETWRGERKATGSYFTPRHIVNYIAKETVGPLAEEAAKRVEKERKRTNRQLANLRGKAAKKTADPSDVEKLREREKTALLEVLEPYLSLKILDPAMGSGHFLVGAADFLTDRILADPNRMPLSRDGGQQERVELKRLVVERCLYGVDLNPLAVELAKLSLWLASAQRDRPLCFLDHHLRCGNSLIGARIADLVYCT